MRAWGCNAEANLCNSRGISPTGASVANIAADRSSVGATYTGLAIATSNGQRFLYAADDGRVDVLDDIWAIQFGQSGVAGSNGNPNPLFFTAGNNNYGSAHLVSSLSASKTIRFPARRER